MHMERFIAVDSGKRFTKIAGTDINTLERNESNELYRKGKFPTKISQGSFDDDAIESETLIAEIDGQVYKIGKGATGEAEHETSKMSDIHRICTLVAIANYCSSSEIDEVHVAFGIPISECEVLEKKLAYKDFILPKLEEDKDMSKKTGHICYKPSDVITVKLKCSSESPVITKQFRIVSKMICPESQGALYLNPEKYNENYVAVIDIGNLNVNCSIWSNFEYDKTTIVTDELGGSILTSNLAQLLSSKFSRITPDVVLQRLLLKGNERCLPSKDERVRVESKKVIDEFLHNHVLEIKKRCDQAHWSLDYMELAFIGGTSSILRSEIKDVFGNDVYIPNMPEYANVIGFLRFLVAKRCNNSMNYDIFASKRKNETSQPGTPASASGKKTA